MLFEFIKAQLSRCFRSALDLFNVRVDIATTGDIEATILPLALLIRRHGAFKAALLCTVVENLACTVLFTTYGIDGAIARTLPFLGARAEAVLFVLYIYTFNRLSLLLTEVASYLGDTFIGRIASNLGHPVFRIIRVVHWIFTLLCGEDHLASTITRLKILPLRVFDCMMRQGEKKIYIPLQRSLDGMKAGNRMLGVACRMAFEMVAITVFSLSIFMAFVFVYTIDADTIFVDSGHGFVEDMESDELWVAGSGRAVLSITGVALDEVEVESVEEGKKD
ncbi:hypothetical protein CPC08DRAFT_446518 [Agrocybe pediades]|nr:hypothetical protein CPC08DRAFT_446518 [Agrocybe pediades]